ncbi:MAG: hypothetical protein GXY49_02575 [Syntrophomonadaceae bacterium]|nr:hypothetical protein [Syntrophomonadaceae bacterium]
MIKLHARNKVIMILPIFLPLQLKQVTNGNGSDCRKDKFCKKLQVIYNDNKDGIDKQKSLCVAAKA